MVLKALEILGFVEFKLRDTHVEMWALRDDSGGTGAIVRLAGFELVPPLAQRKILDEGRIELAEWLAVVAQAQQILSGAQN